MRHSLPGPPDSRVLVQRTENPRGRVGGRPAAVRALTSQQQSLRALFMYTHRARSMLLCLSRGWVGPFGAAVPGVRGDVPDGLLLGCGQDRDGPLQMEREVGLRARFRC